MFVHYYSPNVYGNDFVVGDIHGQFPKLMAQLYEQGFDFTRDRLFCTGDLVNKGGHSEQVIDFLNSNWFYSVRGNHDDEVIHYKRSNQKYWNTEGKIWFLRLTEHDREVIAETFSHLPLAIEVTGRSGKRYGIIHGDLPEDDWINFGGLDLPLGHSKKFKENYSRYCMYSRDRFISGDTSLIKNIDLLYCGHTKVLERTQMGNRVYIDTGCNGFNSKFTIEKLE